MQRKKKGIFFVQALVYAVNLVKGCLDMYTEKQDQNTDSEEGKSYWFRMTAGFKICGLTADLLPSASTDVR